MIGFVCLFWCLCWVYGEFDWWCVVFCLFVVVLLVVIVGGGCGVGCVVLDFGVGYCFWLFVVLGGGFFFCV